MFWVLHIYEFILSTSLWLSYSHSTDEKTGQGRSSASSGNALRKWLPALKRHRVVVLSFRLWWRTISTTKACGSSEKCNFTQVSFQYTRNITHIYCPGYSVSWANDLLHCSSASCLLYFVYWICSVTFHGCCWGSLWLSPDTVNW